jgi:hypothetical protein
MSQTRHPTQVGQTNAKPASATDVPCRRDFLFTGATGATLSLGSLMAFARQAQVCNQGNREW